MKPARAEPRDRERFLAAVAEHVPLDRVVELYLFHPIRQGGVESGLAVIAAAGDPQVGVSDTRPGSPDVPVEETRADHPESTVSEPVERATAQADGAPPDADPGEPRYTVFTARYRHVLKGPERGRWEVSVVAEGHAPLAAVGAVVRGVQRRAGDVEPPERLSGDALREALGQERPAGP